MKYYDKRKEKESKKNLINNIQIIANDNNLTKSKENEVEKLFLSKSIYNKINTNYSYIGLYTIKNKYLNNKKLIASKEKFNINVKKCLYFLILNIMTFINCS